MQPPTITVQSPPTETANCSVAANTVIEVGGVAAQPSSKQASGWRAWRYLLVSLFGLAALVYLTQPSVESKLAPVPVLRVMTPTTLIASPTTTAVPVVVEATLVAATTSAPQTQTLPASQGFRPIKVPAPVSGNELELSAEEVAVLQVQAEITAEAEAAAEAQPLIIPPSNARLTEQEVTSPYSLAIVHSRGKENRTVEVPFGYMDCRSFWEKVMRTFFGLQVCGPYFITVTISANFGNAVMEGSRLSVPFALTVAELISPADVPVFAGDVVWLAVDNTGTVAWPTQAELAAGTATLDIGVEGPWTHREVDYDERWQQALDTLCADDGQLTAEAFSFNQYQASFQGGC